MYHKLQKFGRLSFWSVIMVYIAMVIFTIMFIAGLASAELRVLKLESDFTQGTFSGVQMNKVQMSICDGTKYTRNGYNCPSGKVCCNDNCGFVSAGLDTRTECPDCVGCDGTGKCGGPVAAGEHGLAACMTCNGTSTLPVLMNESQDNVGANLCSGTCRKCTVGVCYEAYWYATWSRNCYGNIGAGNQAGNCLLNTTGKQGYDYGSLGDTMECGESTGTTYGCGSSGSPIGSIARFECMSRTV